MQIHSPEYQTMLVKQQIILIHFSPTNITYHSYSAVGLRCSLMFCSPQSKKLKFVWSNVSSYSRRYILYSYSHMSAFVNDLHTYAKYMKR